ncbi:hypothetical protein PQJ75_30655 [Rhodoplanes sp. TEM]|uniref:DUF304 domain-containing protein n=1 Tax=Rhodoplanes tepidamans TaxID=200616 RepID=A0ABT5JK07_RHOTP|nr:MULTISPECIES: hypothetical protein [Rhodoplanes]MDC7790051.1 hypothetical protein [Rhodoplanes tepidamans]MDC7988111.1 hypothetical protein [Rhodoplanes sp. TEM]MDQ0359252.1 hypothetical protein [Rhodoplanes tepidamans]
MSGDLLSLPRDVQDAVRRELGAHERVLYAGQPRPRDAVPPTLLIFLFGIPWTVFSVFWETAVVGLALGLWGHDPAGGDLPHWMGIVFGLFGLPFVLIGFAMLSAPLVAALKASRSVHVVTDQRLVTLVARPWRSATSHFGDEITAVERADRDAGYGHLKVSRGSDRDSDGDPREIADWWRGIPAVRRAEEAVRQLARPRPPTV